MAIYLACHAMDPQGPDVFAEVLIEFADPELEPTRKSLANICEAGREDRAPRDAAAGRAALRAIVAAGLARAESLRGIRRRRRPRPRRPSVAGIGPAGVRRHRSGEWLRRHQATTSRTLFRTFDALHKIRKEFGDGTTADEEPTGPSATGSMADALQVTGPCEVVEPDRHVPMCPQPDAVEPDNDRNARNVTNEATAPPLVGRGSPGPRPEPDRRSPDPRRRNERSHRPTPGRPRISRSGLD